MRVSVFLKRCGGGLCGKGHGSAESPRSTENSGGGWLDHAPNDVVLRDLQETIDADAGLLILQGHKLAKYEERMARLTEIYQRTAPLPMEGLGVGEEVVTGALGVGVEMEEVPEEEEEQDEGPSTEESVRARELEKEFGSRGGVGSKGVRRIPIPLEARARGARRRVQKQKTEQRLLAPAAAHFLHTQSVAGSSDFNDDEQQTPCEPRLSPCASDSDEGAPSTQQESSLSSVGLEVEKGSRAGKGALQVGTASFTSKGLAAPEECVVRNALFTTTDIFATRDSVGTAWDEDMPTRLVSGKVESFMLVLGGEAHTPTRQASPENFT